MKTKSIILLALSMLTLTGAATVRAQDLHLLYQEGRAAYYAGQFEQAREKLSIVLAKNPGHFETRAMMAQINEKLGADNTALRKTYEKVLLEKIEFTDVSLSEALEAVRFLARKATDDKVTPNIILRSPDLGSKVVSLHLTQVPLTDVLNYLAQLAGARITYDKMAVTFSSPAG